MGCSPRGREETDTTKRLHFHFSLSRIGEGNGNPLQCSCLENRRDRGAWWAAVYGVAQSRTQLKQLSSSSTSLIYRVGKKKKRLTTNLRDNQELEGGVQSGQSDIGLYCWKANQIRECEKRKKKSEFLGSQC